MPGSSPRSRNMSDLMWDGTNCIKCEWVSMGRSKTLEALSREPPEMLVVPEILGFIIEMVCCFGWDWNYFSSVISIALAYVAVSACHTIKRERNRNHLKHTRALLHTPAYGQGRGWGRGGPGAWPFQRRISAAGGANPKAALEVSPEMICF